MKFRHKLSYTALGGLLMLIGMLASSVFMPNLVVQRDKIGEIECTKLTVVDAEGKSRVILSTDSSDRCCYRGRVMYGSAAMVI